MSDDPSNAAGAGHDDRPHAETPTAPELGPEATAGVGRAADLVAESAPMTKADRTELQRVVRLNARVLRDQVGAMKASRLAELEADLSAEYPAGDPRWRTITAEAGRLVRELVAPPRGERRRARSLPTGGGPMTCRRWPTLPTLLLPIGSRSGVRDER